MLKKIKNEEFPSLYQNHIVRDFPPEERPPYAAMYDHIAQGLHECFLYYENEEASGYIITASGNPNGYVLISFLAIMDGKRGCGTGTRLLNTIAERFRGKKGLIIEVEKPECAANAEEKILRERRIAFYKKGGYIMLPGIDYALFQVPMHLMVLPLSHPLESEDVYIRSMREIQYDLLGPSIDQKLKIKSYKKA